MVWANQVRFSNGPDPKNKHIQPSGYQTCLVFEPPLYSGDLKSDHSKSGNFQNPDFLKLFFLMEWHQVAFILLFTSQLTVPNNYLCTLDTTLRTLIK